MTIADAFAIFFGLVGTILGIINWWARKELVHFQDIHVSAGIGQRPESKVPGVDGDQVPTEVWMLVRCKFALFKVRGEKETSVRSKRLTLGGHTRGSLSGYFKVSRDGVVEEVENPWKILDAPGGVATNFELSKQFDITNGLKELCEDLYILNEIQDFVREQRNAKPELTKYYSWGHDAWLAAEIVMWEKRDRVIEALKRACRGRELTELTEEDVAERRRVIESKLKEAISCMETVAKQLESDRGHDVAWQRGDGKWFHSRNRLQRLIDTLRNSVARRKFIL